MVLKHWKALSFFPIALLVAAALFLASNVVTKGSFMERSSELVGGKVITAELAADPAGLPYQYRISSGITRNIVVELPYDADETAAIAALRPYITGEPSVRIIGPALGAIFWQQANVALIAGFAAMSFVVFLLFRSPAPAAIVLLAALTDIVVTMAFLDIIGVKFSLHVLAALLMIIGFSVDTDIVLTTNMLKSGKSVDDAIRSAMKTGLTMSGAAFVSFFCLYLLSSSVVLKEISFVLLAGIMIDIPATYLANAGILRMWLERKGA